MLPCTRNLLQRLTLMVNIISVAAQSHALRL